MSATDRAECILLVMEAVRAGARKLQACACFGVGLRTFERWEKNLEDGRKGPLSKPANALSLQERQRVLEVANSTEFASLAPSQIVPRLADQGQYVASESSFYRILKAEKLMAHRLKARYPSHQRPKELVASGPNEIWSWDITYLKAAIKGTYYFLYLPMDVFSRKIVHWEIHERESAENASQMINQACQLNGVGLEKLVLHSDNGGPMKGATMLSTLQRLGVVPSFSRPKVSNDNPFSESLFRTLKYCPSYPERGFNSLEQAREWMSKFAHWYNEVHLHSGINFVTASSKHQGLDGRILRLRHQVYQQAQEKNPQRWSKQTRDWSRVEKVELNPTKETREERQMAA